MCQRAMHQECANMKLQRWLTLRCPCVAEFVRDRRGQFWPQHGHLTVKAIVINRIKILGSNYRRNLWYLLIDVRDSTGWFEGSSLRPRGASRAASSVALPPRRARACSCTPLRAARRSTRSKCWSRGRCATRSSERSRSARGLPAARSQCAEPLPGSNGEVPSKSKCPIEVFLRPHF